MNTEKMMGFEIPGDQRVSVTVRDWNGMKLALWRAKVALAIAAKQAGEIVERCDHSDDCPGAESDLEPCLASCPDREQRMSALVVLNAALVFGPSSAHKSEEPYFAPSREHYSDVLAELMATRASLDAALDRLRDAGIEEPQPTPAPAPALSEVPKNRLLPVEPVIDLTPEQEQAETTDEETT
jgi:hypothetical protein